VTGSSGKPSATAVTPAETAPYGTWPSPLGAAAVAGGVTRRSDLRALGNGVGWLESRPQEGGRSTLLYLDGNGERHELTPPPCNVRSRVHEYGGGAWCGAGEGGRAVFVDFAQQNLHRVGQGGDIELLTHGPDKVRFGDLHYDAGRERVLCVCEWHQDGNGSAEEPRNLLCAVDIGEAALAAATHKEPHEGRLPDSNVRILHAEHDFYSSPRLSPDGRQLAFVVWDHPRMPWQGSRLLLAEVDGDGALGDVTVVAGGEAESVMQPQWSADGALLFLSDRNGFWNLYRRDHSGQSCVLEDAAEYGTPPWVFGLSDYCVLADSRVLLCRRPIDARAPAELAAAPEHAPQRCELLLMDSAAGFAAPLTLAAGWQGLDGLCRDGSGRVWALASFAERPGELLELDLAEDRARTAITAGTVPLTPEWISPPRFLKFPTRDGEAAYGFYYAPRHPQRTAPAGTAPPLLVMSHGGPTAATSSALNLRIQYYTSRGWAVLDVDYRGSSGYGRSYREALDGRWGLVDVSDCEDGVRALVAAELADPQRIAIRGGSAGGFTTLAALTSSTSFRAGTSHYGIGDLRTLARDTHKFEARYLESLLGEDPESYQRALVERSPIEHVDRLSCPVIFFQGGRDRVVPPNQSEAMVAALRRKGLPVAYLAFPEEGHGFRAQDAMVTALEAEFAFFSRVFAIPAADAVAVPIDNADALPALGGGAPS